MSEVKKLLWIFPLLAIALITQYFVWSELTDKENTMVEESFLLGYDLGINDTINTIINETKSCNTATVFSSNYNITLVDVKSYDSKVVQLRYQMCAKKWNL